MTSYTICAVYPEKGTFKQIKLEEPIPNNIYYNPVTKLLIVTHGVDIIKIGNTKFQIRQK